MNDASSSINKPDECDRREYTLRFGPILNHNGSVQFLNRSIGKELTVGLNIVDQEFQYRVQAEFPAIVADLVDLAVAIHASDRLAPQNLSEKSRHLHIVLPVRHPELLSAEPFRSKLEDLLEWTTGSEWAFEFQKRTVSGRIVERQQILPMVPEGCEVALWSGGLDALAGLYTRMKMYPERPFVLFGSGSNDSTYARQKQVAKKVQSIFPNRCHLVLAPIRLNDSREVPKNKITRARGVVFTLLGAACAYLLGRRILSVYENGIGAINLPYRASAVGLDHSRSVHPLTLLMVSEVVSELFGEKFQVKNPFLFSTKAEMCQALATDGKSDLASLTISCDSPHRKPEQPTQCGYCSSCILRKQALAAAKIEDKSRYILPHGERPSEDPSLMFRHMLAQLSTFRRLLSTSNEIEIRWEALRRKFPELDDIVDRASEVEGLSPVNMQSRLIRLYWTYVSEWDIVEALVAGDLLDTDNKQQISHKKSLYKVERQRYD
ncbi:7-cyano-7-deazaguanine synthase [Laspinema olomoucense]|uniref:7-cyano-7-deazaguanine synthase n=1 Tax=Laspinema olomoucense D3b TaxID=2953688 RepID=A0ABT2N8P4_9CYAN|nr:7-cyano-7-deazaguanine synthase [Laspinema sp. D3b]MCT7979060.1 7-cyano-7-deazaguanine synthase [Laspinema sp. D3b]